MYAAGPFSLHTLPAVLFIAVGLQPVSVIPADAEWRLVDSNANATVYVDPGTVQRVGDVVRLWVLDDLKTAHTRGADTYVSSRAREEHDCVNERFRLVALAQFAGHMGTGAVIYKRSVESKCASIPTGTLAQSVWKYACGKK
jgi:hypothetical protein